MTLPPWHLHIDAWAVALALEGAYLVAIRRGGGRHALPGQAPVTRGQVVAFTSGVLTILVASTWPIHDIAERHLLSVHMVQHLLLSLIVPPLLLIGTPAWMMRRVLSPAPLRWAVRVFGRPVVAFLAFNGVIVLTHWPVVVDLALRVHPVHLLVHVALFGSATLMWWQVLSPLPEHPAMSYPGRMLFLFLQSIVPTVPASFLTFGSTVIYPFYAEAPTLWGVSPLTDQLVAGLIMKIVGSLILWSAIAVFFFKWWQEEQSDGWDALKFRDVEREIRGELTRAARQP